MVTQMIDMIRGLERERYRAMIDGDGLLLDTLLSDNVSYIHTNGKRETKQQFIDAITSGRRRYRQIEIQSQEVLPAGAQTCIVTGRALIEMEASNGVLLYPVAYTGLQVQEGGQWRLMAWQATRCATE
ncbi:nuclear transport factor 2 family protein [Paraburkholderia bonniea]|uniref:nuclear transport factor 2 family protein n=1 Tax=Paraburkholderia bonniea TaxID=2152891 RepID=UPI002572D56E|nr:nuclear transport factor 2 family protein [Paraburkholderia bonniea]WJF89967.1 nuclear transport factor 2 family protein [Paraburkholderia bonniea]WJF93281.1 nuclear transport factor 2 family protein [Paraburkholderia bonniea]